MASLALASISKRFDTVPALSNVQLNIEHGEFFVLLGPSGAGKTTTLRVIAGLEQPDAGTVHMNDEDVTSWHVAERDCAFVFQQYSLYPHLSVYDNIAFPLRSPLRALKEGEIKRRVSKVAEILHIDSKLDRRATALSGGEMQRVALGRALVREPRVFLMDEPLSSLDAKLREELRVEIKRIQQALDATVVYVTHDQVEATTMADRIGILESGQLRQVGTPQDVYENPCSAYVAQRLGSPAMNFLPVAWFAGHSPLGATQVAVRPEDIRLVGSMAEAATTTSDTSLSLRVIESSLPKHELIAERDGVQVNVSSVLEHQYASGDLVHLEIPVQRCLYFSKDGQRVKPH